MRRLEQTGLGEDNYSLLRMSFLEFYFYKFIMFATKMEWMRTSTKSIANCSLVNI